MLHESLYAAVEQAQQDLIDYKCVLVDTLALVQRYEFDGVPYGTSKRFDGELKSYKGKNTRKWFHVTITRMDSGRYEVVSYPL